MNPLNTSVPIPFLLTIELNFFHNMYEVSVSLDYMSQTTFIVTL